MCKVRSEGIGQAVEPTNAARATRREEVDAFADAGFAVSARPLSITAHTGEASPEGSVAGRPAAAEVAARRAPADRWRLESGVRDDLSPVDAPGLESGVRDDVSPVNAPGLGGESF